MLVLVSVLMVPCISIIFCPGCSLSWRYCCLSLLVQVVHCHGGTAVCPSLPVQVIHGGTAVCPSVPVQAVYYCHGVGGVCRSCSLHLRHFPSRLFIHRHVGVGVCSNGALYLHHFLSMLLIVMVMMSVVAVHYISITS